MRVYKLEEASEKKARFINNHPNLNDEQKNYLVSLYLKPEVPDNIIEWQKIKDLSFDELKSIAENYLKDREEKKNKKNLSKAIEGRDYIKIFENTNEEGTEYLYLPLTWLGSKYLASDHFLPKIKVPSKVMNANDFSDNTAKNTDLSPGAKWCISLWTIPDWVRDNKPFTDLDGKEFRHEGKRYWLEYTSDGAYFLFYFRDIKKLKDTYKKRALTLKQGSPKILDVTLADDTEGVKNSNIKRVQEYWREHYKEYESQIEHIQEVSTEEYPKFMEYERQKEQEAIYYYNSHRKDYTLRKYFTYNESTGRYDREGDLYRDTLYYLVKDGEFTVPLGVVNGTFNCNDLRLRTLKNGPTEVTGNLNCSENDLISLEGAPQIVGGNFICYENKLTTLEYAPQEVGGGFSCSFNKLTTLEGSPEKVGGYFICKNNNLTTLEYAPQELGGNFDCGDNKLTNLKGAPEYIGGNFYCSYNNLTTLKYAPKKVVGDFNCSNNQLKTLEGAPEVVGGSFDCFQNNLTTLEYAPNTVERDFVCSYNNLTNLRGAPNEVGGSFICVYNNLKTLEGAPEYVGLDFYCSWNGLTTLEYAPKEIGGNFCCDNNPLQSKELSTEVKGRVFY